VAVSEHAPVLRIGVLSRRLGVSDHVLRAWERRYGLLRPVRTPGGFRLYSEADARRIRDMKRHLARGLSAAEAARAVLAAEGELDGAGAAGGGELDGAGAAGDELRGMLREALDGFDEPGAQAVLDRLLAGLPVTAVLRDVVLPYLSELGDRWERGQASIAQEHFASNLIRGRLAGLARGWGEGSGPRAVLACPPGEWHDLALMMFGIALNRLGWPIDYLGVDTPAQELSRTVGVRQPGLVVLAATQPESLERQAAHLTRLAREVSLALAGPGASPRLAGAVGARLLDGDPVSAAGAVGRPT
jgi:MerR family transcriptional regulator, light-induced transcriptional regulator